MKTPQMRRLPYVLVDIALALIILLILGACVSGAEEPASPVVEKASLKVNVAARSEHPIPRYLTGKFCEHLFFNVTNGMDAQILKNPTFEDYPFRTEQMSPDGLATFHYDKEEIARQIRNGAGRWGWPESDIEGLIQSRQAAVACWWAKLGPVAASPDTGPHGGRAQRIKAQAGGQGLMQWTWLPLHRIRHYDVTLWVRSPDLDTLTVAFFGPEGTGICAEATISAVNGQWQKLQTRLHLPDDVPADKAYRFAVTADGPGQFVVDRVLLYPADHVNRADPDVIRFLKDSHLPILRWPGGNFVSSYHWRDGVGPLETRPTLPNYAWGQQENNFFGTDEFIAFCRAVGCEPMICANAGSGTPAEAAQWIEYCNGAVDTPMGRLRAAHGHPEPYNVKHWEIGNELWGQWQYRWTTPEGYADRFRRFWQAMHAADSRIELYACGAPVFWGKQWNDTLITGTSDLLRRTTDHPLIGGNVPADTDPLDVFRDFMAVPDVLQQKWGTLEKDMKAAGIVDPRLAVTELQMFGRLGPLSTPEAPRRLTHDTLVHPGSQAEALYDVLIYHAAIRLAPFVDMVTHSATVNHGGGLRKDRERVYANPCHYAQTMFAAFAEAVPVGTELTCATHEAPRVLPDLRNVTKAWTYKTLDVVAARGRDGRLLISVVHKGTDRPVELDIALTGDEPTGPVDIETLSADVPWAVNTREAPEAVVPVHALGRMRDGKMTVTIKPYTVMRLAIR